MTHNEKPLLGSSSTYPFDHQPPHKRYSRALKTSLVYQRHPRSQTVIFAVHELEPPNARMRMGEHYIREGGRT